MGRITVRSAKKAAMKIPAVGRERVVIVGGGTCISLKTFSPIIASACFFSIDDIIPVALKTHSLRMLADTVLPHVLPERVFDPHGDPTPPAFRLNCPVPRLPESLVA